MFRHGNRRGESEDSVTPESNISAENIYTCWINIIMSPKWEAVLLFIFYLALRWFPSLKSLGIVLLGTSVLLCTKNILVELGMDLYRLGLWFKLLKTGEFVLPTASLERFHVQIIAYSFLIGVIFFPLYLIFGVTYIILALIAGRSDRVSSADQELESDILWSKKMWRKLGWIGYEYARFWPPLFRNGPTVINDVNIRWPIVKWRYFCSIVLSIFMTIVLMVIAIAFLAFSLLSMVSILTFLFGGMHIAVFIVSAIEILVTVYDIDLTQGFYEHILLSSFIIPAYLWLYLKISKRIGTEALHVMQMDNRCSKRGQLLAQSYSKIPSSFEEAAVTMSNDDDNRLVSFADLDDLHLQVKFIKQGEIHVKILDEIEYSNLSHV